MKLCSRLGLTLCLAIIGSLPAFASQNVDEVIKLHQGGASADVLVAFVEKSTGDPRLSGDDLDMLEKASVPAVVIEAMLAMEKAGENTAVAGAPDAESVTLAPAADNADISYFYDSMSHDGSWTNDAEYGWSWCPTISAGDNNWRPYVDNGSWVYTNDGWYWNSGYNWGWAAFHYGRWSHRDNRWSWHPDNVWGSSWVSWRNNDNYYGWAPLTPRARFGHSGGFDIGLTTGNFDINIGLGERDYAFVRSSNFLDRDLHRHQVQRNEVAVIYNNSTVSNNYTSKDNHYSNHGLPVKNVELATKQDIKPVSLVDQPHKAGEPVKVGGMQNNRLAVYRPTLAAKASVEPAAAVARRTKLQGSAAVPSKPALNGEPAKANAANENEASRKAEAIKRVSERAAKEPKLPARSNAVPHKGEAEPKAANPTGEANAPKTHVERPAVRVPEPRETPRTEAPKAREPITKEREEAPRRAAPERPEPKAREEAPRPQAPSRPEPKAREEQQRRSDPPQRSEKQERPDRNEK